MTDAEIRRENVDTPDEIHFGSVMSAQREAFLQRLMSSIDAEKKAKPMATVNPTKGLRLCNFEKPSWLMQH